MTISATPQALVLLGEAIDFHRILVIYVPKFQCGGSDPLIEPWVCMCHPDNLPGGGSLHVKFDDC
jgi:hypothetical protein